MGEMEKHEKLLELVCQLSYLEWLKLRHAVDRVFETKITSVSNTVKIDTEAVIRRLKLP